MNDHCPGCCGWDRVDWAQGNGTACPGLTCPACAEREAAKAKWGVYPCDQCAAKNEEIACLHSRIHQLESGYDTLRTVLHRKDAEIARLRALVAVGREMSDYLHQGMLSGRVDGRWDVVTRWRSLEGKE